MWACPPSWNTVSQHPTVVTYCTVRYGTGVQESICTVPNKGIVLADFGEQNSRKVCMGLKKLGGHEILRKFWYGTGKFLVTKGIEFFGRSFCRKGEWEGENLDPG